MSVLSPWKRRAKLTGGSQSAAKAFVAPKSSPGRSKNPTRTILLLTCMFLLAATTAVAFLWTTLSSTARLGEEICHGDSLLAFDELHCLVSSQRGTEFWGASGKIAEFQHPVLDSGTRRGTAYIHNGISIAAVDSTGQVSTLCSSVPGENILQCPTFEGLLLLRQGSKGAHGEPWILRAVSSTGSELWEIYLPGIPTKAGASSQVLVLGLHDVAAGGNLNLVALEPRTGTMSWMRPVGTGHWRATIAAESGEIVCATSAKIIVLDETGRELWSYSSQAELSSLVIAAGAVVASSSVRNRPLLQVFSKDGSVVWQKELPSPSHALQERGNGVVALCQNHVIGFSLEDGHCDMYLVTRDLPLALVGDVLLMKKSQGICLVKIEITETRQS